MFLRRVVNLFVVKIKFRPWVLETKEREPLLVRNRGQKCRQLTIANRIYVPEC